jgi:hypothetical protein
MQQDKPWQQRKAWAANEIASEGRKGQWALWAFAALWNLLTLPLLWQIGDIWRQAQREPVTALAFLFPLVGLGLIVAAARMTMNQRHFGPVPLLLDPFPGSLGGQVGGTIDTRIPFDPDGRFTISLSCVRSYMSGSGKNRSRSESVVWQGQGVCHTESDGQGTRIRFRFDVPGDLPPSDVERGNSYHLWRASIEATLDGPDFVRRYDIPVFATGAQASSIAHGTESHVATEDHAMAGVEEIADIRPVAGGIEARFPAMRRPLSDAMFVVFGLIFLAAGIGAGYGGASMFLAVVVSLVALPLAVAGIFGLGKSLLVGVGRDGVRARRFLFGYPLWTRRLERAQLRGLRLDKGGTLQMGNKHIVYYKVLAEGEGKRKVVLGERLEGRAEAELLLETYRAYLG